MAKLYSGSHIALFSNWINQTKFVLTSPETGVSFAIEYSTETEYSIHMMYYKEVICIVSCGYVMLKGPWLEDLEITLEAHILENAKQAAISYLSMTGTDKYDTGAPSELILRAYEGKTVDINTPTFVHGNLLL